METILRTIKDFLRASKLRRILSRFPSPPALAWPALRMPSFEWPKFPVKASVKLASFSLGVAFISLALAYVFAIKPSSPRPQFPDPALYAAAPYRLGNTLPSQTLQMNLSGARVDALVFDGISIGATSGITYVIEVKAASGKTITCDEFVIDGLSTPNFVLADSEIYDLQVTSNVSDGNSITPTLDNSVSDITITSTRDTIIVAPVTGGNYDRIVLDGGASGATVRRIEFKNINSFGGDVDLGELKCGSLQITNSTVGDGDGLSTPDLKIISSVKIGSSTLTNNDERPLSVN